MLSTIYNKKLKAIEKKIYGNIKNPEDVLDFNTIYKGVSMYEKVLFNKAHGDEMGMLYASAKYMYDNGEWDKFKRRWKPVDEYNNDKGEENKHSS